MRISFKQLAFFNLTVLTFTVITVLFFDRSIALFMHNSNLDQLKKLRIITEDFPIFFTLFILIIILAKSHLKFGPRLILAAYFYLTLYLTIEIKTGLKIIFGRYWPKTWINNNLSLIHNNVFGFDYWHGAGNMGSFPSGHTTYITFCTFWLISLLPSLKYLFIMISGLVPISLIMLDYHFLGDCTAGILLGVDCAIFSLYMNYKIFGIKNE